jgi:ubiquinone/menaquinone biosynthesis C-methylase UbiE
MAADARFEATQRRYFARADDARFRWTTAAPGFADTEDALLEPFLPLIAEPALEIGCGEGNNLVRLARRGGWIGVDLHRAKLAFAATHVAGARFVAADALALPFPAATFRTVFVRDLLHHIPDPAPVLAEAMRVLAPGGRFCLLEPNAANPIVLFQTYLVPAEALGRRSGPAHIADLLRPLPLAGVDVRMIEPLPLRRLVLHYRFGVPALGRFRPARTALRGAERLARRFLAPSHWAYVMATGLRT